MQAAAPLVRMKTTFQSLCFEMYDFLLIQKELEPSGSVKGGISYHQKKKKKKSGQRF
jgi:hypothetical protein